MLSPIRLSSAQGCNAAIAGIAPSYLSEFIERALCYARWQRGQIFVFVLISRLQNSQGQGNDEGGAIATPKDSLDSSPLASLILKEAFPTRTCPSKKTKVRTFLLRGQTFFCRETYDDDFYPSQHRTL